MTAIDHELTAVQGSSMPSPPPRPSHPTREPIGEMKTARRYIAKAEIQPDGTYYAIWAAPGMTPEYVAHLDGSKEVFGHHADAEAKARMVLFNSLNSNDFTNKAKLRPKSYGGGGKFSFTKMTGPEFAHELSQARISPAEFAFLWGTSFGKVTDWMKNIHDVPFPVRWVLRLLRDQQNLDTAIETANANAVPKE